MCLTLITHIVIALVKPDTSILSIPRTFALQQQSTCQLCRSSMIFHKGIFTLTIECTFMTASQGTNTCVHVAISFLALL
jgi:hypothetical protein